MIQDGGWTFPTLYRTDPQASNSQLQVGGQYSDTDSVTLFVRNNAFLRGDRLISITDFLPSKTNSDFEGIDGRTVKYKIETLILQQKLLFEYRDNVYLGGQFYYRDIQYSPNNDAGRDFLFDNGIVDEDGAGLGVSVSFDSRGNKYFPRDAHWVDIDIDTFPEFLGTDTTDHRLTNARYYKTGFNAGDVWASQFFGQYVSEKAPDTGLPTLSGKSMLRGFPAGQFKARYLTGVQTEYRYQLVDTSFRLIAFGGAARLSGGSYGRGGRERHDNGSYWAFGVGLRYAIQSRSGVDLRLDVVTTNESEQSVYLALNQAF